MSHLLYIYITQNETQRRIEVYQLYTFSSMCSPYNHCNQCSYSEMVTALDHRNSRSIWPSLGTKSISISAGQEVNTPDRLRLCFLARRFFTAFNVNFIDMFNYKLDYRAYRQRLNLKCVTSAGHLFENDIEIWYSNWQQVYNTQYTATETTLVLYSTSLSLHALTVLSHNPFRTLTKDLWNQAGSACEKVQYHINLCPNFNVESTWFMD